MFSPSLFVTSCALDKLSRKSSGDSGIEFEISSSILHTAGAARTALAMASMASLSTNVVEFDGTSRLGKFRDSPASVGGANVGALAEGCREWAKESGLGIGDC